MRLSKAGFTFNNVFSIVVTVFVLTIFVGIFVTALVQIANPSAPGTGQPVLSEVMRWFNKHPHRALHKGFKDLAVRWAWWTRPPKRCDLRRHLDDLRRDVAGSHYANLEAPRVLYGASNIVKWFLRHGHGYFDRDMILSVLDWSISGGHSPYAGPADRYLGSLSFLPQHTQALFVDMCRDMALTEMGLPLDPDFRGDDDPPVG